eukprot:5385405-Alexandrium_andersonii.AAC.1
MSPEPPPTPQGGRAGRRPSKLSTTARAKARGAPRQRARAAAASRAQSRDRSAFLGQGDARTPQRAGPRGSASAQ